MTGIPIGTHLRRYRFMHGEMTQANLAAIVGVTRQTIVALETTRYAPSLELAMKLATVFDCTVDELFFWNDVELAKKQFQKGSNS